MHQQDIPPRILWPLLFDPLVEVKCIRFAGQSLGRVYSVQFGCYPDETLDVDRRLSRQLHLPI